MQTAVIVEVKDGPEGQHLLFNLRASFAETCGDLDCFVVGVVPQKSRLTPEDQVHEVIKEATDTVKRSPTVSRCAYIAATNIPFRGRVAGSLVCTFTIVTNEVRVLGKGFEPYPSEDLPDEVVMHAAMVNAYMERMLPVSTGPESEQAIAVRLVNAVERGVWNTVDLIVDPRLAHLRPQN